MTDMAWLTQLLERNDDLTRAAESFTTRLEEQGQLTKAADVVFRCQSRCLLLAVYRTKGGVVVYLPAYKLSPAANAEHSTAAGRAENTTDGDRRWRAHSFFLEQAFGMMLLNCDHLLQHVLTGEEILDALASGTRLRVVPRS